jgi:hypothetical protein
MVDAISGKANSGGIICISGLLAIFFWAVGSEADQKQSEASSKILEESQKRKELEQKIIEQQNIERFREQEVKRQEQEELIARRAWKRFWLMGPKQFQRLLTIEKLCEPFRRRCTPVPRRPSDGFPDRRSDGRK